MGVRPVVGAAPVVWRGRGIALDGGRFATVALVLLALLFNLAVIRVFPPALDRGQTPFLWPLVANVAHGNGYVACNPTYFLNCESTNQVTAMYEPLPILAFAGVAALTRDSLWAIASLQVLVSVATLVAVVLLTRYLAGPRTALLAGLFWALYLPALRLVPQVAGELIAGLGVTWGVLAFLYARRTDRTLVWLAAGASLGLGTLSRSAVLAIAPALVVGLLLWAPSEPGRALSWRLRRGVLVLLACAVVQVPWVVRNDLALGRPIVGSTLVGYNLFREAQALTTPGFVRWVTLGEGADAIRALMVRRPDLTGSENEAQLDTVYRQEALLIIAAHPLRYLVLAADHFLMLWFNWGVGGLETDPKIPGPMAYLPNIQQVLLLGAGLVGVFVSRWRRSWPLVLTVVAVCVSYMAVHAQQRYLVPVMPVVIVLAAVGCAQLAARLRLYMSRGTTTPEDRSRPMLAEDAPWAGLVSGVRRLERETYALYLAGRDARTPWYAKVVGMAGLALGLGPVPNPIKSTPALDRLIDIVPIVLGVILARRLVPRAVLVAHRARAQAALARPRRWHAVAGVLASWLVLAVLTAALLIWDPV